MNATDDQHFGDLADEVSRFLATTAGIDLQKCSCATCRRAWVKELVSRAPIRLADLVGRSGLGKKLTPPFRAGPWKDAELLFLFSAADEGELTVKEVAYHLQRTYASVVAKRSELRKKGFLW